MSVTPEHIAELRSLSDDYRSPMGGDNDTARELASEVPALLDEIERLRTQLATAGDVVLWPDDEGNLTFGGEA